MFTGPGIRVAGIAYGITLPSDELDVTDQSPWDVAFLIPEGTDDGHR